MKIQTTHDEAERQRAQAEALRVAAERERALSFAAGEEALSEAEALREERTQAALTLVQAAIDTAAQAALRAQDAADETTLIR